jgi:hypothetical protein
MNFSDVKLPSNRKFGFFFTVGFGVAGVYFLYKGTVSTGYALLSLAALFLLATLVKSELLLPLNKLWVRLGLLLGIIISPIVLGILFFGLFTPIAFLMQLAGRDELRLKLKTRASYWKAREPSGPSSDTFKHQF